MTVLFLRLVGVTGAAWAACGAARAARDGRLITPLACGLIVAAAVEAWAVAVLWLLIVA